MKQFQLKDSPIVYYISGRENKEWVLFLHAAFVTHDMFQEQASYFQNKYNVLTLDIIGHGKSINTRKGDSIHGMSKWIHEILTAEEILNIHIVGISLGAVLAQDFANRYPEAVRSLACFGGYDINHFDSKMQKGNSFSQMLMMGKAIFSVKWFARDNRKISAYTLQAQNAFYEMNIQFPKKSFRYLATLNRLVNAQETAQRKYPLLIGCGQHDIPMERSAVEMWREREPDSSVVMFENAGHCVNMDAPQKFNKTLEVFWSTGKLL